MEKKDIYERINYLYQAAHVVLERKSEEEIGAQQVSRHFGAVLKTIAKRSVLKLDPSLKRTLCKKCYTVLIPGVTSSIRLKSKRELHYVITCLHCKAFKRLPLRKDHQLWSEDPQAQVEFPPKKLVQNRVPNEDKKTREETDVLKGKTRSYSQVKEGNQSEV